MRLRESRIARHIIAGGFIRNLVQFGSGHGLEHVDKRTRSACVVSRANYLVARSIVRLANLHAIRIGSARDTRLSRAIARTTRPIFACTRSLARRVADGRFRATFDLRRVEFAFVNVVARNTGRRASAERYRAFLFGNIAFLAKQRVDDITIHARRSARATFLVALGRHGNHQGFLRARKGNVQQAAALLQLLRAFIFGHGLAAQSGTRRAGHKRGIDFAFVIEQRRIVLRGALLQKRRRSRRSD